MYGPLAACLLNFRGTSQCVKMFVWLVKVYCGGIPMIVVPFIGGGVSSSGVDMVLSGVAFIVIVASRGARRR